MYLKALEIQGFKSFPERTRLTFEKNITAVVGPNGSGKSNIADAILWVMGEQKTKTLRGSRMEDVIFGGTSLRSPMGFAEVSLIIDNSSRIIDSDYEEIVLTRRYFRSGDSEYYINREEVRLKDLNSLLMDTGLGRDGYSIIGQGKIADIVSTKSTDRREVFDEAAGISRYRYRKEEAERRLERTDANLVRINDKIEELEYQVEPLQKQSEVAKKYLGLRDNLRVLEVSSWLTTLDRIHEKADSVNAEYNQACDELLKVQNEREALYTSIDSLSDRMHRKDEEIEDARTVLSEKESTAAEIEQSIAVLKTSISGCKETQERLVEDITQQEGRTETLRATISQNNSRISSINTDAEQLKTRLDENSNVLSGCKMKIESREKALNSVNDRMNALSAERMSTESRINMLAGMEKEYEGYSKAVKSVMKESSRGNLKGVHGPVSGLVKAGKEYALAVETALGAAGQNIVIDSRDDARRAIDYLKRTDSGRATFLPVDTIRGSVLKDVPVNDEGFIGLAYDLVSFDKQYDEIIASLLGKTIVTESLSDAVRISKNSGDRYRIVSLDGQMIHAGGSMTGGSAAKGTGILSRANELEELRRKLEQIRKDENSCRDELEQARLKLSAVRYDMDMASEDRSSLTAEMSSLNAELQALEDANRKFNELLESISYNSEQRRAAYADAQAKIDAYLAEIAEKEKSLSAVAEEISKQREAISGISDAKIELEGRRSSADKDAQSCSDRIIELERTKSRIEQRRNASEMEEKTIIEKLWDNYELSHSAAQAIRQPVESMQRTNREIAELRREISALGTPNIGAIEEYKRVSERYGFLKSQRDDVQKAKEELLGIISDVTGEMKSAFLESFRQIDEAFRLTFTELFGGGKAALVLEDEENVLECGIEIKVQPPGKALSVLSLLSGGEMAFVAIALYFAILKVRPTPFCVMDEIEAALDESNVSRFAEYMRRMSDRTQFIVITHRRGTMEEADMLYGVTMQEKGVSTVLELDLEEARKTAEN